MKKLKKMIVVLILLILLIMFLTTQKVFASNSTNLFEPVEYSDDFKRWLELSDEEKKNVMMPRMYDVSFSKSNYTNPFYKAKMLRSNISQKYDLRDIIPANLAIRDQKQTNSCWAFASISSLETNLALSNYKKGVNLSKVYDFSERHMEYSTSKYFKDDVENSKGFNRQVGSAGTYLFAETYLANGYGAIPEAEMPFENNENIIDISQIQNKTVSSQLYDFAMYPDYNTETGEIKTAIINQVKQHIQNYGSVYAGLHGANPFFDCFNYITGAQFCNNSSEHPINHAVSIVGWDDNYSVDNFNPDHKPTSNGAWIVRNSWGTNPATMKVSDFRQMLFNNSREDCIKNGWNSPDELPDEFINFACEQLKCTIKDGIVYQAYGDNGFIYVSYEDVNISKNLAGIVKATDTVNYDNIYYYDELGFCSAISIHSPTVMLCNLFDKKTTGPEYLTHVSLSVPSVCTCKVYVNPNGTSKSKSDLQLVSLKDGESETLYSTGYHSLEFSKPVEIKSNSFAVVVEIQSPLTSTPIYLESKPALVQADSPYYKAKVENGKCFVTAGNDLENSDWIDLGRLSETSSSLFNSDSTIKAFTTTELIDESLKNIEITTPPTKTSYFEGENFDKTGMVVKANYNSRTKPTAILDASNYTITNGTDLKAGQTSVTITYEDKSVTQAITVEKNTVTDLKIKTPPAKVEYKEGQNFDKSGMVVEATFKDGTKKTITDYKIENGNNLKTTQTEIKISYGEKTVSQPITVIPNPLVEISITTAPTKVKYGVGENFDKSGMVVTGTFQDKSTQEIVNYTIENGTNLTLGQTFVTIKYEGKTANQPISVVELAENSNFDNATCNVKKVQAYYFTNDAKKDYALINVDITGISKTDDSVEYYYYLSSNKDEKDISNWVKITENQNSNDALQFVIDSRKIADYNDIADDDILYLYVKEVVTKGSEQSVFSSKAMRVVYDDKVETFVDNVKVDNVSGNTGGSDSSDKGVDDTLAHGRLPFAGVKTVLILALIVLIFGLLGFARYKNLSKYVK